MGSEMCIRDRCYIYCTKDGKEPLSYSDYCGYDMTDFREDFLANGKVVAEFVCDRIDPIPIYNGWMVDVVDLQTTRLTVRELLEYAGGVEGKKLYGWHISELKIYDKPKELRNFSSGSSTLTYKKNGIDMRWSGMKRPPQSWCYVEKGGGSDA